MKLDYFQTIHFSIFIKVILKLPIIINIQYQTQTTLLTLLLNNKQNVDDRLEMKEKHLIQFETYRTNNNSTLILIHISIGNIRLFYGKRIGFKNMKTRVYFGIFQKFQFGIRQTASFCQYAWYESVNFENKTK